MSARDDGRIPVTILTGFLGAGKTTLLNRLLADPAFRDTAVVINEFGAVGVDGDLVETASERAFAQTTGCLCCTVEGDVRLTLLRLADAADTGAGPTFSRLVIETTGLADPAPVLQSLMTSDLVIDRYALNGVVAVVDAATGETTLDRFDEARRQAAVADLILISKGDIAGPEAAALARRLARSNPNARILPVAEAKPRDVFGLAAFDPAVKAPDVREWLRFEASAAGEHGHVHGHTNAHAHGAEHEHAHGSGPDHRHAHDHAQGPDGHARDANRHSDDVSAFCATGRTPVDPWAVQDAIEALQQALGPDLLRLKAIVQLDEDPETPVVLHVVQHVMHPPGRLAGWPEGLRETRLVVIARGPGRAAVPGLIARFLPELSPVGGAPAAAA